MGRKSAIIKSPYQEEIRELLGSGWSPNNVRRYLIAEHGDGPAIPSAAAMYRYRARHMPPAAFVPISLIRKAIGDMHYHVDTVKLLDELIWAQEQRIAMAWRKELETATLDPELTGALRLTMEYMKERHKIAGELGVERRGGRNGRISARQTQVLEMPESSFQEILGFMEERRREIDRHYAQPHDVIPAKEDGERPEDSSWEQREN